MTAIERILSLDPCKDARDWLNTLPPNTSAADGIALCPRGSWLLWLAGRLGLRIPEAAYRPTVTRALAPDDAATVLAAKTARTAAWAAETARTVAGAAAWAELAAEASAEVAEVAEAENALCAADVRSAMGTALVAACDRLTGP